jgi:hypothetical protein
LCQDWGATATHCEADSAEAKEHHRPGTRLRDGLPDGDAAAERAGAGIVAVDRQRVGRGAQRDRIGQTPELVRSVVVDLDQVIGAAEAGKDRAREIDSRRARRQRDRIETGESVRENDGFQERWRRKRRLSKADRRRIRDGGRPETTVVDESTVTTAPAAEPTASAVAPTTPSSNLGIRHLRNGGSPLVFDSPTKRRVSGLLTHLGRNPVTLF